MPGEQWDPQQHGSASNDSFLRHLPRKREAALIAQGFNIQRSPSLHPHSAFSRAMSTAVDPTARTIPLDGLPLAILTISCVFLGLSIIAVSLRTYARLASNIFGFDDAFIILGTVSLLQGILRCCEIAKRSIVTYAAPPGRLHCRNRSLNKWNTRGPRKTRSRSQLMAIERVCQILHHLDPDLRYCSGTGQIKCLYNNFANRVNQGSSTYYGFTPFSPLPGLPFASRSSGTLLYCKPVNAIWMPQLVMSGQATCSPVTTLVIIGHVATVSTIATDLALVVVPAIILWNTQMSKQAKFRAFALLSFASA